MNASRAVVLAFGLWLGGCSADRSSGGTAETENAISAREFRVDSLLPEWNRPKGVPTVATLRLDSNNFLFRGLDPAGRDLDIRRLDGSSLPFEILLWDPPRRQARLRVRLDGELLEKGSRLAVWQGLPTVRRENPTSVWSGIPDSQRIELTSVLVDDFEGGSIKTRLPDSSSWYLATSAGTGITLSAMGRAGHAVRLVSTGSSADPVALAAALLVPSPKSLRSIDSIVFWARGKGDARGALERAGAGIQVVAWSAIALDTSWQRIRIVPGSFDTAARTSGGARWDEVRDSLTHLSFWMQGAGELWIDDPRLYGIDRDDLR